MNFDYIPSGGKMLNKGRIWLERLLRRLLKLNDTEALFRKVESAAAVGDLAGVLRETDRIISRSYFLPTQTRSRTLTTVRLNSADEYQNYLRKHPSLSHLNWEFPIRAEAHFHRALAYERTGRLRSSRLELEKSLEECPKSARYSVELGFILLNARDYDEAARRFQEAAANDLTSDQLYKVRATMGLGLTRLEQGEFAAARQFLLEVSRLSPEDREVWNHLRLLTELENDPRQRGEFFISRSNWTESMTAFNEALAVNPHDYEAHLGLAYACKELEDYQSALKHLRTAFLYNPNGAEVNFALGWIYLVLEQYDRAEAELQKAISKNCYDANHFIALAYLYLERFKAGEELAIERLEAAAKRVKELNPSSPDPHLLMAEYHLCSDQLARAQREIAKAIELAPSYQDAHVLAAEICLEMGRKHRSLFHLEEAIDFGNDTDEIRLLRSRLEGDPL